MLCKYFISKFCWRFCYSFKECFSYSQNCMLD